jgi:alpha-mannosidase
MPRLLASLIFAAVVISAQTESKYELPAEQRTGSIKRILVLPHAHLDIGFTLPPDQVARDYKDSIDAAIRLVRENPDFRWTIESTWMLNQWLRRTRNSQLIDELGRYLRDGRISLAAGFANMHSGLIGDEEMNRLSYLAEEYRKRFSIPVEVAIQNDVPGFSWAYPRVFAGSGVKYLITGLNLFIGGGNDFGVRNNPFYWKGPDGSRVLTFFTYESYIEGYRWKLTRRTPIEDLEKSIPRRLAWLERNGYPHDTYLLMTSVGDNADPMHAFGVLEKVREWNRRYPELPMQICTPEDYFRYVTQKDGAKFPEFSGDATGHWELVKLGAPEVASRMRETASLLPSAEALHHIATLTKGGEPPWYDLREAWHELLVFHEHTAGAGPGWPGYYTRWQTDWSNAAHYAAAMGGY